MEDQVSLIDAFRLTWVRPTGRTSPKQWVCALHKPITFYVLCISMPRTLHSPVPAVAGTHGGPYLIFVDAHSLNRQPMAPTGADLKICATKTNKQQLQKGNRFLLGVRRSRAWPPKGATAGSAVYQLCHRAEWGHGALSRGQAKGAEKSTSAGFAEVSSRRRRVEANAYRAPMRANRSRMRTVSP